jgi:hypothetical protein
LGYSNDEDAASGVTGRRERGERCRPGHQQARLPSGSGGAGPAGSGGQPG